MIISGAEFAEAKDAHVQLGADTQQRLAQDEGLCRFQQLLRSSKSLSATVLKAQDAFDSVIEREPVDSDGINWGDHAAQFSCVEQYKDLLQTSEVVDAIRLKATTLSEATTQAIQYIQEASKEYHRNNENSWKYTVADDASIDQVLDVAKTTLETVNLESMEKSVESMKKAAGKGVLTRTWTICGLYDI